MSIIDFLKAHQLNIMLFMSGICFVLAILTLMTKALTMRRRRIIAFLEIAAMLLLLADRYAYLYRGDPSTLGFWMVRISNFLVYLMTLYISHALTLYLYDLFHVEGKQAAFPRRIWICGRIAAPAPLPRRAARRRTCATWLTATACSPAAWACMAAARSWAA